MALGTPSSCINHPGIEAAGRCKQCGKPFCSACAVSGPTGKFCGDICKQKHEAFIQRAQQLDRASPGGGYFIKARRLAIKLVIWVVVILAVALVLTKFHLYEVPYLSPIIRSYTGG